MDFLDDYNELQQKAIRSEAKKICVFAGPGTGKTKTLVGKYAYLQKELKVSPSNILCLTFTRKAAEEMAEKIRGICGENRSKYIGTIHGMANRILSEDIYRFGFPNKYSILTEDERRSVFYGIMSEMNLYEDDNITYKDIVQFVDKSKREDEGCEYFDLLIGKQSIVQKIQGINEEILETQSEVELAELKLQKAFYCYLRAQSEDYYLDYNDLILISRRLLETNEFVRKKWSSKFQYVLVDEFQDLTDEEYDLITSLSSEHGRIFGVGDPDQSIYGFRGSKTGIFNDFYENCDEHFDFTENYRSYQGIVDLSHDMISADPSRIVDIRLHCHRGDGGIPTAVHVIDRRSEAVYVADRIQELVGRGVKRSECAILYRNNQCSLVFEEYFQLKKIPYKVYSANEFFSCDEVKTAISYLKFIIYRDNISFLAIYKKPTRYISNAMIGRIKTLSAESNVSYWQTIKDDYKNPIYKNNLTKFVEFIESIESANPNDGFEQWCLKVFNDSGFLKYVFSTGDEDKANHMKQLIDMIHSFEPDDPSKNVAEQFLNYLALLSDGDVKEEGDKVQMMSIHCSKGMQYRYVFVVDFNEGYIPSSKAETKEDFAEERRIAYVAFTRAKDGLYILESKGEDGHASPSSFSNSFHEGDYKQVQYTAAEKKDIRCISVGSHVRSKLYGNGVVKSIDSFRKKCEVEFIDYYKPKEVDLASLVNIVDRKELSFDIDPVVVEEIKKKCNPEYSVGEIVIHKDYGAGIITKIKDGNRAFVQFREMGSMFDLDSNSIVRRNDYLRYKEGTE